MFARRDLAVAALAAAIACDGGACDKSSTPPAPAGPDAASSSAPRPEAEDAAVAAATDGAPAEASAAELDCPAGEPRAGKSIGHTSVVFKLELVTDAGATKKVVYKPRSRRGGGRYKGEIAAYRLAEALGLRNVLPACPRSFAASTLERALAADPKAAKLYAEEVVADEGLVHGALIPWFDGLEVYPIEQEPLRSESRGWLKRGAAIPADRVDLARQISTLIAFDFVTGNWDRWSGANVGIDKTHVLVVYIDNDGAFFEAPPADALSKNRALVKNVDRFSRSFVERLRALDEGALGRALGEERRAPLLSERALRGVLSRRSELLAIIDAKAAEADAGDTLYFR